jgi:2-keto-4-pentenoate hydratase/2-oxohepta-3-ene-1,7-dioic acid hydratase in catechol pathway/regulator of RNase E activity RraA
MIAPMPLPAGLAASKVIAVHLNYRSRAAERGRTPSVPSYFLKPPSTLTGDGDLVRPRGTELMGYEGEIAAIIGTRTHRVRPDEALAHVGWYAPANDAGVADLRWNDRGSNLLSKGHDGFTPIGPAVAAADVDPGALVLRTRVNGAVVQEDVSSELIFSFADLVADLSRFITLEPGDVILTGTPTGTGVLGLGDVVEVELEGAGSVRSTVVEADHDVEPWGAQPKVTPEVREWATGEPAPRAHELSPEAWEMLRAVGTATLTQQLQRRGVRNSWLRGVRSTRPDLRMVGYARTLRYVALREDVRDADTAPLNAQKAAVEAIEPGEVLVMEAREDPGAGTIGDILAARVLARGGTGIVTDGGLRDSPAVGGLDIPTYFKAPHGSVLGLIHYPLASQVPITCGGVLVMPGDVIVGDAEGAVVVPAAMAEEVARDATEQELREEWALERVQAGDSVRDTFPMAPERRDEFEAWRAARAGR